MAHWRDTYRPARFFFLDSRAGIPLLMTLVYIRPWTVCLSVFVIVMFWWFERLGLSTPSAVRAFRAWLIGDDRPARFRHKTRHIADYGRS